MEKGAPIVERKREVVVFGELEDEGSAARCEVEYNRKRSVLWDA